ASYLLRSRAGAHAVLEAEAAIERRAIDSRRHRATASHQGRPFFMDRLDASMSRTRRRGHVTIASPTLHRVSPSQNGRHEEHAHDPAEILTGSQITCRALEAEGVDIVFGYPGGAVIPLYDALPAAGFHHVLVRFEQWAALAADGYARATGRV